MIHCVYYYSTPYYHGASACSSRAPFHIPTRVDPALSCALTALPIFHDFEHSVYHNIPHPLKVSSFSQNLEPIFLWSEKLSTLHPANQPPVYRIRGTPRRIYHTFVLPGAQTVQQSRSYHEESTIRFSVVIILLRNRKTALAATPTKWETKYLRCWARSSDRERCDCSC